jgi:flagellar hook protein FlgE
MISGYNSALSALQSFGTKLHSNSNNIANANTNEFKRTRVLNATVDPTGVKAQVEKVNTAGPTVTEETSNGYDQVELSNVDLGVEIPDMNLNSTMYKANLKTIETVNEMTGELLKLKA